MSEAPVNTPAATDPPPSAPTPGWKSRAPFLVALLAIGLLAAQWVGSRNQIAGLQQELSERLSTMDSSIKQTESLSRQTQGNTQTLESRLAALENQVAQSQNQQIELEAMYQELTRNRDGWILAEVEHLVVIASQDLQLSGNVPSALTALQAADQRLQKANNPVLISIRQVINQDMDRLRALPYVDTAGISSRLDNVAATVDALPLASDARPGPSTNTTTQESHGFWGRLGHELAAELGKAVQVRRMDAPELPLLTPDQAFFLRENLKLHLLSARQEALSRDETGYRADLQTSTAWLARYFDREARSVQVTQATLHQLSGTSVNMALPDLSASLNAIHNARMAQEGPRR